jgi:hypothetical protein
MKDVRLKGFREALEGLSESLDAFVRVSRWADAEPPPEPLRTAAAKLADRLGTAERLCTPTYVGTPVDTTKVNAMVATMKRLDGAYANYRKRIEAEPAQSADALGTLEAEIGEAIAAG